MMEQVFYIFCTTLPGHVLPLALLWHFPWRSRRTALVLMLCNVLCKTAAAAACIANGIGFRGLEILFSFLGFVIYLCCSRLDFFRLLSVFILAVDYLLLIRGISSFLTVRLFSTLSQSWESSVCALLLGDHSVHQRLPAGQRGTLGISLFPGQSADLRDGDLLCPAAISGESAQAGSSGAAVDV